MSTAEHAPRRSVARWWPWLAMAVVVLVALGIGTFDRPHRTDRQRAQDVANTIRCPTCKSQSVSSSDTPASKAVRSLIRERIKAGDSDDAIRDFVAAQYGRQILLDPSAKGFSGLVWALPVMMAVVAVAALVFRFRDWRPGTIAVTEADRTLVADALEHRAAVDAGDVAGGDIAEDDS
jgi:cytochrome c-type biogenesis protein CcmH/NrfF